MMFSSFCSVNLISPLLWTVSGFLVERNDYSINPEETGDLLEGDIVGELPPITRNGFIDPRLRWPYGVVPYEIAFDYPKHELLVLMEAIEEYNTRTCIRLREKTDQDVDYISIHGNGKECWSYIGRIGGKQELNLATGICFGKVGTAIHELMHVIGFTHEHNRFDRDDNVWIEWANIREDRKHNFVKMKPKTTTSYGVAYDYKSVMHYSMFAFSKNRYATIVPKEKKATIGQRDGFSRGDITKINIMYDCSRKM